MVNWSVTATTIYCDAVADEATLMVFKDGTVKCTAFRKYRETAGGRRLLAKRGRQVGRPLACDGPVCPRGAAYRDRLFAESSA
ncbi:MAG: hypothetical protein HYX96_05225 [Chloroflexi bacterium]|nr:hypothetical protein [Chloroflexota bacterium]